MKIIASRGPVVVAAASALCAWFAPAAARTAPLAASTLLKTMATEGGFVLGPTEVILWGGPDQATGEKEIKDGRATLFGAGKPGATQTMGFFAASDAFFVLAWGQITPRNVSPVTAAAAKSPARNKAGGDTPADLVGPTWRWITISSVGHRDTVTKQLTEPSGMSVRFTFSRGSCHKYFFYVRQRTYNLVTESTSTHEGRVTFGGDNTFTLRPAKGHYKGSTGSKIVDRPMTDDEKKPVTFFYEWRTENGKRQLYIGPSKSSLSRFQPAEESKP